MLAHLVERGIRIAEVTGSSPVHSTTNYIDVVYRGIWVRVLQYPLVLTGLDGSPISVIPGSSPITPLYPGCGFSLLFQGSSLGLRGSARRYQIERRLALAEKVED